MKAMREIDPIQEMTRGRKLFGLAWEKAIVLRSPKSNL
jgi:hypothetical protein